VIGPSRRQLAVLLHLALGLIIAVEGTINVLHGLAPQDRQLIAFGAAEGIGALVFLWPRALRVGGCVLVCTFLIAAVVHLLAGEFPSEHLVYAVAVLLVMTHGPGWWAPAGPAAA
jgi:hypothetical protein